MAWARELDNPKVCIATILGSGRMVSINWARALREMQHPGGTDHYLLAGMPWGPARNNCVKYMLEKDFSHLLFWDSDVIPPTDGIVRLLRHNLDIVSGIYFTRYPPLQPVAYYDRLDAGGVSVKLPLNPFNFGDILQVDLVGMGFCMISRRVFENMPAPWFIWEMDVTNPHGPSEDFHFCRKARTHGFAIYLDTGIQCEHETRAVSSSKGLEPELL